jgi:hypothetical protein
MVTKEQGILREELLKFYALMTKRGIEDVKREYLGIAPAGSSKYAFVSNKLHVAVETFLASTAAQKAHLTTKGGDHE